VFSFGYRCLIEPGENKKASPDIQNRLSKVDVLHEIISELQSFFRYPAVRTVLPTATAAA